MITSSSLRMDVPALGSLWPVFTNLLLNFSMELKFLWLQPWEKDSDVLYCRPLASKGEKVTAVTDGMPTW